MDAMGIDKKYYVAYGSNMSVEQMKVRCPNAKLIGRTEIKGYKLAFRGTLKNAYATIIEDSQKYVPAVLWEIDKQSEKNLDEYEGFPNMYYKDEVTVGESNSTLKAMVYIMTDLYGVGSPSSKYYGTLEKAYERFKFDLKLLEDALWKKR